MKNIDRKNIRYLILTIILAFMFEIFPLPIWLMWFRPAWMVLLMIYWLMVLPHRIGIGTAFTLGILLDVMSGTLIGEHALALCVVAGVTLQFYRRMWLYSWWQQSCLVAVFTLIYEGLLLWIQGMTGHIELTQFNWLMALSNGLLWPAIILFNEEQWRVIHADLVSKGSYRNGKLS